MTDQATRYARVQALLAEALDLPANRRGAFLDQACAGDPALRAEVDELLALTADDDGDALLGERALEDTRRALDDAVDGTLVARDGDWLPERIGHYRVVRKLGQGGMGVVYEAEQVSPHRRVAIKLLHPMLATPERLKRFRQEAAVLGRLTHPGIAQVFEAGRADTGRGEQSFLVMELVEGRDLRTHCEREGLDRRARVKLLAEVAEALHHAHEHGVVHRDVKPDNVLVDAHGRPRILDFGIARVEGGSATLSTIVTEEGQLVGTLAYMAPEQLEPARGRATRQVDVYALGVLGFELLVGRLPHDVADLSLSQAITLLTTRDVPRAGRLAPELRGDLETILGKALEPDTARRYDTAAALAADLRRHLDHRPIRARPPSRLYLVRKFTRRHRGLVAGAIATFVTLVAGTIISLFFADDAAEQRDLARLNERRAVNGLLQSAQALIDSGQGLRALDQLALVPEDRRGTTWRLLRRAAPDVLDVPSGPWTFRGDTHMVAVIDAPGGGSSSLVEVSLLSGAETRRLFPGIGLRRIESASRSGLAVAYRQVAALDERYAVLDLDRERVVLDGPRHLVLADFTDLGDETRAGERSTYRRERVPEVGDDGRTVLWYAGPDCAEVRVDGEVVQVVDGLLPLESVHLGPDGATFAVSRCDAVTVRDVQDGATRFTYAVPDDHVVTAFPVLDGVLLADGAEGCLSQPPVRWRRLPLGPPGRPASATDPFEGVRPAFPHPIWPGAWWPDDGRFLVVGSAQRGRGGFVVDTDRGAALPFRRLTSAPDGDGFLAYDFLHREPFLPVSPDGSRLAIVDAYGSTEVVELDPRETEPAFHPRGPILRGHADARGEVAGGWVYHLALSADGRLVASAAPDDPLVRVWDLATGEPLGALERATPGVGGREAFLAFDARGDRLLVTTPWPGRGLVLTDWDLADGTVDLPVADLPLVAPHLLLLDDVLDALGPRDPVTLATHAVLRDGRVVTTGLSEETARGRTPRWAFPIDSDRVYAGLDVDPTGALVAIACQEGHGTDGVGTVVLVNLRTNEVVRELALPAKPWSVAFHPDGTLLAVGANDGRVLLFDTGTWMQELDWPAHVPSPDYAYVKALAWTPDGTRLVTASGDATVRIWDTRTQVAARVEDDAWRALRASMAAREDLAEVYETLEGEERAAARAELMVRRGGGG